MSKKVIVISDVDGCLTDGKFIYTADGKVAKTYGPHDNDGVKLLRKNGIEVQFISADKRGFDITSKRITDMKCPISLVSEAERATYLLSFADDYDMVVFFGDGLGDLAAANKYREYADNLFFAAPANAYPKVALSADYVTDLCGGNGAFLDLAEHLVYHEFILDKDEIVDLY